MEALREWTRLTRDVRDDEGRPLGEGKASPEQRRDVPMDLRPCPYADSRQHHGKPMNVSALKQMLAHWPALLGGIAFLRALYRETARQERLRLIDVWRLGRLTTSLAEFACLRAWMPCGDGKLPAAVAVLYKAPLGVSLTAGAMWSDGAARFDALVSGDELYEYADRFGHFIGADQVCAGPVALVKEVLGLLVDGNGPAGDPSAAVAVMGDSRRFLRFAHAGASLALLSLAPERLDAGMAGVLAADPAAPVLSTNIRRGLRLARFLGLDAGADREVVNELLGHVGDPCFAAADLGPGVRAIREPWAQPLGDAGEAIRQVVAASGPAQALRAGTREAIARHLARFCAVERAIGALVRLLKGHVADALGIDLAGPRARELHLVGYVPTGIRLTRALLREALAIDVDGVLCEAESER